MGSPLFDRAWSLTVDTLKVSNLDGAFTVKRSLKKEPNTAEITIRNLAEDNRKRMEERREVRVVLEAGYKAPGQISMIFAGDLREVYSERDCSDINTIISSGDGEKKHRQARINKGLGPGTSIKTAIKELAKAMGVGLGNLEALGSVEFPKAGAVFPNGAVLSGNVADELDGLLRSAGLEYSIQNGVLQILDRRQTLAGTALVLSSETGLIGRPSISNDGTMRARVLMLPDLFPGRRVELRTDVVKGIFRVNVAEYTGDTKSDDWFVDIECEPLPKARVVS